MDIREKVVRRDKGCCVRCHTYCIGRAASIHHRKRRSQAARQERDQPQNLVLLCGTGTTGCHGWVHAHVSDAQAMGYLLHAWEDPLARPVYTKDGWKQPLEDGTYKTIN